MVQKIKPVTKIGKTRKVGSRRRLTMKGLYYSELINKILDSTNRKIENDNEKDEAEAYVKEYNVKEKHFLDKYV